MKKRASITIPAKKAPASATSSRARIIRAVASSTAIETGQPIQDIEARLSTRSRKLRKVGLA